MAGDEIKVLKVFISYSQDSPEHNARVLALANRLINDGIHCYIDRHLDSPPEGWPRWMERQIREADLVLVICTARYLRRVRGEEDQNVENGVRWESVIIYQALYDAGTLNTKFIPVLFKGASASDIPTPIKGATRYFLSTEADYKKLYRRLTNQSLTPRPKTGELLILPPGEESIDFLFSRSEPTPKSTQELLNRSDGDTFVLSEQEETSTSERSTSGTPRVLNKQQTGACRLVNKHYEGIRGRENMVKEAHRFFSKTQEDIYPDQCRLKINPVLKLSKPVQNFNTFLDKAHLPTSMYHLRSQLKEILNRIEVLLSELVHLKMDCCPKGLKAPIKQRQDIQRLLKELVEKLERVNNLMKTFNRLLGLLEDENQHAEDALTRAPGSVQYSERPPKP